jgi:hypothetical protein
MSQSSSMVLVPKNVVVVPPRYHSESWSLSSSYRHHRRRIVAVVSDEASPEIQMVVGSVDPYSDDDDDEYGPWFVDGVVDWFVVVAAGGAHWCTASGKTCNPSTSCAGFVADEEGVRATLPTEHGECTSNISTPSDGMGGSTK